MTPTALGDAPRMMLGRCLRGLREHAKLSIDTVAAGCEVSKATWSRVENGVTSVKSHDVERACQVLGVTDAELIHALTELAKQTKTKSWLSSYGEVVSDNFRHFISLEASANAISTYEPEFVPGLLQTPGYMRALMANDRFTGQELPPEAVVAQRLEVRLKRQQILTQDSGATRFAAVIGESALRRLFGGPQAMIEQLVHLLRIGERDKVDLRVMPHDRDHAGIATGQFILMEFPPLGTFHLPPYVYVDGYVSYFLTEKPDETKLFKTAWPSLQDTALHPRDSADLILSRLQELQQLS
jgi:transcriptional regulator with XRE-family HTH domain